MGKTEYVLRYEVEPERGGLNRIYFALLSESRKGIILFADPSVCGSNPHYGMMRGGMGYPCEKQRADTIYDILAGKKNDKSVPEEIGEADNECRCPLPGNVICRGLGDVKLMGENVPYAEIREIESKKLDKIIGELKTYFDCLESFNEFFDPVPV